MFVFFISPKRGSNYQYRELAYHENLIKGELYLKKIPQCWDKKDGRLPEKNKANNCTLLSRPVVDNS